MSEQNALKRTVELRDQLKAWALEKALPIWWTVGADHERGGFFEKITQEGLAFEAPRRARVAARQVYVYAAAKALGWDGPWREALEHALFFFINHYVRPDGLIRTLVAPGGEVLDETVSLYDQAFALFCLAAASEALPEREDLTGVAVRLREALVASLKHPEAGFEETNPRSLPLQSNPHMHLFEAFLAWVERGGDARWRELADEIAELALGRFIQDGSGALREFFAGDWSPMPGVEGRLVEPGHQFEWAWLLLRWSQITGREDARSNALRLIAIADDHGIDPVRGVAYFALLDDLTVHDANARLWPQTERIKAGVLAARLTGDARYWSTAAAGAEGLLKYLDVPVAGLWVDRYQADGSFVVEPAPASSLYHIICGLLEMDVGVTAALETHREVRLEDVV
ncbi:AGE family epimerase/isomerase [Caulobacter segnis]|uniref:AGE family epimerase/isomerase n=1 Tax=Caulobacter segnis TaxID=88688 RepID=UPI00285D7481|nr:AGE family epimerase/isomerase [Caulobacter segnis]MDR6627115.1 mannose-6-phosphate isomerase [Caulobacter segnis]